MSYADNDVTGSSNYGPWSAASASLLCLVEMDKLGPVAESELAL